MGMLESAGGIHKSSVNFRNLIRDMADMYAFDVSEVVIVELVANALDSKATRISIDYDPATKVLTVTDNAAGMDSRQFDEYHDFAAGLKVKGSGIGFAGLGAKVSFNIAERVVTETRSDSFSGGSDWYFQSNKDLVWKEIPPRRIRNRGTRVEVHFLAGAEPSYSSTDDLVKVLRRHYLPLTDSRFLELYQRLDIYSADLRFCANGRTIEPLDIAEDLLLDSVHRFIPKRGQERFGYGVFGVAEADYPLGPDACGVLVCTYGKVIKREWFDQLPGQLGSRIVGLVEVPALVRFLTTSKTDFIRGRGGYREFEGLYGPIREEFKSWLKELGVVTAEELRSDEARRLERELKKLLDDVPELREFFGFREKGEVLQSDPAGVAVAEPQEGIEGTFPVGDGVRGVGPGPVGPGEGPGETLVQAQSGKQAASPIARSVRAGPKIAFHQAEDRTELAWIEGSNVVINSGHPCYVKAHTNPNSRRLHSLFAIATAVQRFLGAQSEAPDLAFVDRMMAAWGKRSQ